jgi:hypothetical protein
VGQGARLLRKGVFTWGEDFSRERKKFSRKMVDDWKQPVSEAGVCHVQGYPPK